MPPPIPEILQTLSLFASTQRLVKDHPSPVFPVFSAVHIERMDAAIRLIGALHASPGAQIILSEIGSLTPYNSNQTTP